MQNWSIRRIKGLMRGRRALPVLVVSLAFFFITVFSLGQAFGADSTRVPGSENDPLVTASWVEAKINERLRQLEGSGGAGTRPPASEPVYITLPAPTYQLVTVPSGRKMLTGSGTEIILRSGSARLVEGPGGGLSDLTSGTNLSDGDNIARDHLLLSPKDDGRGIMAATNTIFMVRGDYNLE